MCSFPKHASSMHICGVCVKLRGLFKIHLHSFGNNIPGLRYCTQPKLIVNKSKKGIKRHKLLTRKSNYFKQGSQNDKYHDTSSNDMDKKNPLVEKYECSKCLSTYGNKDMLKGHIGDCHSDFKVSKADAKLGKDTIEDRLTTCAANSDNKPNVDNLNTEINVEINDIYPNHGQKLPHCSSSYLKRETNNSVFSAKMDENHKSSLFPGNSPIQDDSLIMYKPESAETFQATFFDTESLHEISLDFDFDKSFNLLEPPKFSEECGLSSSSFTENLQTETTLLGSATSYSSMNLREASVIQERNDEDSIAISKIEPESIDALVEASSLTIEGVDKRDQTIRPFGESDISNPETRKKSNRQQNTSTTLTNKGKFTCSMCNLDFIVKEQYNEHILSHKNPRTTDSVSFRRTYTCHCGKSFLGLSRYLEHGVTHSDHRAFACTVCDKTFKRDSALKEHMYVHTSEKNHACSCGKYFATLTMLRRHATRSKCSKMEAMLDVFNHRAPGKHVCAICKLTFKQKDFLQEHYKIHAGTVQCDKCAIFFPSEEVFTQHGCYTKAMHHESKPTMRNLKEIKDTSRSQSYVCSLCCKQYDSNNQLQLHNKRVHDLSQHIKCSYCDKTFVSRYLVKQHEETHTKEFSFLCQFCGKGFPNKQRLAIHTQQHKGVNPFECDVCGRCFETKSKLQSHIRSQCNPEKTFSCMICEKKFRRKPSLLLHRKRHAGMKKHVCKECDKSFVSANELKIHSTVHTNTKAFRCHVCGLGFKYRQGLARHAKVHSETIQNSANLNQEMPVKNSIQLKQKPSVAPEITHVKITGIYSLPTAI